MRESREDSHNPRLSPFDIVQFYTVGVNRPRAGSFVSMTLGQVAPVAVK